MLGARYTNRDVSSFQTRDLYCNGRNMYVQLSHLLFVLEMFRWYVVLDKFVSYSRRQWTSFFHNFKLELYSFCEPCPYVSPHYDKLQNHWTFNIIIMSLCIDGVTWWHVQIQWWIQCKPYCYVLLNQLTIIKLLLSHIQCILQCVDIYLFWLSMLIIIL